MKKHAARTSSIIIAALVVILMVNGLAGRTGPVNGPLSEDAACSSSSSSSGPSE